MNMLATNEDEDEIYDLGSRAEVEPDYNSLVRGISWSAIEVGHPTDNEILSDWIQTIGGVTLDIVMETFDELWDVKMISSSAGLKALQKLNELMDDVETFNFAELVRYIEEKTPLDTFLEHAQDFMIHLTESDVSLLDSIPLLSSHLDGLEMLIRSGLDNLQKKLEETKTFAEGVNSRFLAHAADTNIHITVEDKQYLQESVANFDNPIFMRGCSFSYTSQSDTFTEEAVKDSETFAFRKTDFSNSNMIVIDTTFYLPDLTQSIRQVFNIAEDGTMTSTIEEIEL